MVNFKQKSRAYKSSDPYKMGKFKVESHIKVGIIYRGVALLKGPVGRRVVFGNPNCNCFYLIPCVEKLPGILLKREQNKVLHAHMIHRVVVYLQVLRKMPYLNPYY